MSCHDIGARLKGKKKKKKEDRKKRENEKTRMISKVIFVEHVSPITSVSTPDIRHSRRIYL